MGVMVVMARWLSIGGLLLAAFGCTGKNTPADVDMSTAVSDAATVPDLTTPSELGTGTDLATLDQTALEPDLATVLDLAPSEADLATAGADLVAPSDDLVSPDLANPDLVPDVTAPKVVNITSSNPNGSYGIGATIVILVQFDEPLVVTGTPRLTLETGAGDIIVDFTGLAAPDTMEFVYTALATFSSSDLDVQSSTALGLNGGTIKDAAGNDADRTLPVGAAAGSLATNKDLVLDGARPFVTAWSGPTNGTYHAGDTVPIAVTFSEIVSSTDATLTLALDGATRVVPLTSGSGTPTLVFNYVVQSNDFAADLDYATTTPLGGAIVDLVGNGFASSQPAPGPCETSLGGMQNLAIAGAALLPEPIASGGTSWNEYYRTADDTTACATTDVGALGQPVCAHGGEARRVRTAETSCSGLSLTDSAGAFTWRCSVVAGKAEFRTTGWAAGKGLKDLVTATGWKPISVTLAGCGASCPKTGAAVKWWTNEVAAVTAASGSLFGACKVWVLEASQSTAGYSLGTAKGAFVALAGATLSAQSNNTALVSAAQAFQWLEGAFANGGRSNVSMQSLGKFARVHAVAAAGLHVAHGGDEGALDGLTLTSGSTLRFDNADHNLVNDVAVTGVASGQSGIDLVTSTGNELVDVRVSGSVVGSAPVGVGISLATGNRAQRFEVANVAYGFHLSAGNTLANGRVSNCVSLFDTTSDKTKTILSQVLIAGCLQNTTLGADTIATGLTLVSSPALIVGPRSTLVSVASHNAAGDALSVPSTATGVGIAQLAVGLGAVRLAANTKFVANLLVTNPSQCAIETGGDGLGHNTCLNSAQSAATYTSGRSLDAVWIGKASGDANNPSDTAGTATYSDALDWLSFIHESRVWGIDGSAFPNGDHTGPCVTGTCRIWDWRLASASTVIRNTSGNGTSANGAFTNNAACPTEVNGNRSVDSAAYAYDAAFAPGLNGVEVLADGKGDDDGVCEAGEDCVQRFLRSAIEMVDSGTGDHDGLCEAGETCLYAPNFGAYQGHGALQSCVFSASGGLTGITMMGRATNGN